MYWTKKHVLICTASHCSQKGANDVAGRLRLEVIRRGLDTEVLVNNCGTIDLCDIGPNIVIYPDNIIFRGVTTKDIPDLIEYLRGGPIIERLLLGPDTPEEQLRRDFYRAVVAAGPAMPVDEFEHLAAEYSFDAAWIAEQQRRGFIARKPLSDGEGEAINATKKATTRYGI
jgi:(2Fe-2S) ferredoxin